MNLLKLLQLLRKEVEVLEETKSVATKELTRLLELNTKGGSFMLNDNNNVEMSLNINPKEEDFMSKNSNAATSIGTNNKEDAKMKNRIIKEKIVTLYRFMSLGEVSELVKGETITRNESYNGRTTARPTEVCFMTGNPIIYGYRSKSIETIDPLDSLSSLDGVVDTDVLVEISVPVSRTRWGAGYYADFIMEEVYLESYSAKDVTKAWQNQTSFEYGFETKDVIGFIKSPKGRRLELFNKFGSEAKERKEEKKMEKVATELELLEELMRNLDNKEESSMIKMNLQFFGIKVEEESAMLEQVRKFNDIAKQIEEIDAVGGDVYVGGFKVSWESVKEFIYGLDEDELKLLAYSNKPEIPAELEAFAIYLLEAEKAWDNELSLQNDYFNSKKHLPMDLQFFANKVGKKAEMEEAKMKKEKELENMLSEYFREEVKLVNEKERDSVNHEEWMLDNFIYINETIYIN